MKKVFYIVLLVLAGSIGKVVSQYTLKALHDKHLEQSYEKQFNVKGDNYYIKKDQNGLHLSINNKSYNIDENALMLESETTSNYIDSTKFLNYLKSSNNIKLLKKAMRTYGFLWGNEAIVDWCAPYYKLDTYPTQFKQHFEHERLKAENVLRTAYGDNWRKFIEKALKGGIKIKNKQINDEYEISRRDAESSGVKLSKRDFCRLIDSNVDYLIKYQDELFNKMSKEF